MRHFFGYGTSDFAMNPVGTALELVPGATGTVWDSAVGGTQITDLTDVNDGAITTLTADDNAQVAFYGPDGVSSLYVDFGFGIRFLMTATDLGAVIDNKASLDGADFVGPVLLAADPTDDLEAATKAYVDTTTAASSLASGGTVTGDLTVTGRLTGPIAPYGGIAPSRNTPAWRPALTSFQFQSGHGWSTNGTASNNLNNTTGDGVRGTQYASITTDTAQGQANLKKFAMPAFDLTHKAIRLICRVSDVTKLGSLNFYVGTSSVANNFKWRLWEVSATSQLGSSNEWITLTFGWSSLNAASGSYTMSSTGVPSTTTGFTDMQVQAVGTTGNAVTLDVQAIEIIDGTTTTFPNGVVSIVFDDGSQSIYDYARPAMDTYGFQGTNYVIVGNLGTSGVMTSAENKALQDFSGWEIGLHAYSGVVHDNRYSSYTAAQVDDDIRHGKEWLVRNGFRGEAIAYPGGDYQRTTDGVGIDSIASRYFSTGRTILFQGGFPTETFPAGMPMRMRAVSSISSTQTGANNPANMVASGGLLDKCQLNGGWLVLVFHKIVTGTASVATECSQSDFQTIMAGISTRGIPVVPVSDIMRLHA
ncbi:polysaccharide deacetylase family protein [Streptomyces sp. NPDC021020]|uniref:polysaccharide deacetylase family protein n=1 Tax=Streptomyces sp. NPDC021020 TaxID=3365109 RepID=UPI0037A3C49F